MSRRVATGDGGPHTHGEGFAGRDSGGRPKGIASEGLLQSPFEHCEEIPPEIEPQWAQGFDWYTFICSACGTETYISRELHQSVPEFVEMCSWLFGRPPVCGACQGRYGL